VKRLSDQTLYEIIEVSVEAPPEEIARACDRAAATYGPGSLVTYTLASSEESALLSNRIEEARAVLLDPSARSRYDERIGVRPHATPLPPTPAAPVQAALPALPPPEARPEPVASSPAWPPAEVDAATAEPLHISPGLPVVVPGTPPGAEPAVQPGEPHATGPAAPVVSPPPPATPAPEGSPIHGGPVAAESTSWPEPASPGGEAVPGPAAPPQVEATPAPAQPSAAALVPVALARLETEPATPVTPIALTRAVAPILLDREIPPPRPLLVPEGAAWSGELLRRVRESRGLTLQQVAERTRITRHHLENIELDRFKALPAAVYLRGIIMSLARELRLDGQKVARSYLDRMGPPGDGEAER